MPHSQWMASANWARRLSLAKRIFPKYQRRVSTRSYCLHTRSHPIRNFAGELGTMSCQLESDLTRIFALAARWNSVVLDEADIFMETPRFHEIGPNASVSVFLKVLEYYKGIIILTTNSVVSFEDAFRSRIHIALIFSELDL
ncbi:hypothetical protein BGX38DRAFT_1230813 [Terfezia claveryi]|nr:hypothetical protein BGX38DRAFT_1230813 [Terfezia claveryi]